MVVVVVVVVCASRVLCIKCRPVTLGVKYVHKYLTIETPFPPPGLTRI